MVGHRATVESGGRAKGTPNSLVALEALLSDGWQIEPPVLNRLSWAQQRAGDQAFHFIVSRGAQRSLVVIADGADVRRFLVARGLPVAD